MPEKVLSAKEIPRRNINAQKQGIIKNPALARLYTGIQQVKMKQTIKITHPHLHIEGILN